MQKNLVIVYLTTIFCILGFTGCTEKNITDDPTDLHRFIGTWGEEFFAVYNTSVVFGEIIFYPNHTGKAYQHSPSFSENFTYTLTKEHIQITLSDRYFTTAEENETSTITCTYTFSDNDSHLVLTGLTTNEYESNLLKKYTLSPTTKLECGHTINTTVPKTVNTTKNQTTFTLHIYNPLYAQILIHDCFYLENATHTPIGNFTKHETRFILDLHNPSNNPIDCETYKLNPYEHRNYSIIIQNAEEGQYRISMRNAIMNTWCFAQGFAQSNDFYIQK